jgi:hypothetical protein
MNACSSPISGSERPDLQGNSTRQAGWSFPIVQLPHTTPHSQKRVSYYSHTAEYNEKFAVSSGIRARIFDFLGICTTPVCPRIGSKSYISKLSA